VKAINISKTSGRRILAPLSGFKMPFVKAFVGMWVWHSIVVTSLTQDHNDQGVIHPNIFVEILEN
jgi:hypothetical protein